jgi:hypothetical protein
MTNINEFLTTVLSTPDFHIPVEANFVIQFNNLSNILNNLNKTAIPDSIILNNKVNNNDKAWKERWDSLNTDDIYFANGVTIPGETVTSTKAGFTSNNDGLHGGLLSGPVLTGRANLANFEISFLETNQSFADQVIRPWIVKASHFGLFARASQAASSQNFKTNITVMFLDKTKDPSQAVPRKTILFKNAVPVSLEQVSANYGGSRVASRNTRTTWTYSQYEIS